MAAAVADHRPAEVATSKIKRAPARATRPRRRRGAASIELVKNPDLLGEIGAARAARAADVARFRPSVLVGFAVETAGGEALVAYARRKLEEKRVDLVVANEARDSFGREDNRVVLVPGARGEAEAERAAGLEVGPGPRDPGPDPAPCCKAPGAEGVGSRARTSYSDRAVDLRFRRDGRCRGSRSVRPHLGPGRLFRPARSTPACRTFEQSTRRAMAATTSPMTAAPSSDAVGSDDASDAGVAPEASCDSSVADPLNCGTCGVACDTANSTGASCAASVCSYTGCQADWLDCDQTGARTTTAARARRPRRRAAARAATSATPPTASARPASPPTAARSSASTAAVSRAGPTAIPPGTDTDGCETSLASPSNCGACGKACDTKNSQGASCVDGTTCSYTGCNSGFADCDTDRPDTNGCETKVASATCNACGASCDTTHSNGASCQMGSSGSSCKYTSCASGYANCNTTPPDTNGCETQTTTPRTAAAAGSSCDTKTSNGASCSGGNCQYTGCAGGFADCVNAAPNTNGCESSLSSTATCGGCNNACNTKTGRRELHRLDVHVPVQLGPARLQREQGAGHRRVRVRDTRVLRNRLRRRRTATAWDRASTTATRRAATTRRRRSPHARRTRATRGRAPRARLAAASCSWVCLGTTAHSVCGSSGGKCYCWQYSGQNPGKVESEGSSCSASCGGGGDPSWN